MTSTKNIGMDVHKESISVRNDAGNIVMECVGLRGDVHVTFEEGTWATWLYDLLKPHVTKVVVWRSASECAAKAEVLRRPFKTVIG